MKLLAWDTSSKFGSIAALEWTPGQAKLPRLAAEWSLGLEAAHSDRLLWAVHQLLEACKWTLDEVDYFGVGVGPGSFTGIRIGVTTARSLALATGKPLVGVSSLSALVRPVAAAYAEISQEKVFVVGATDACKGEIFVLSGIAKSVRDCVSHEDSGNGALWKRGVEEALHTPESLSALLEKRLEEKDCSTVVVVGEARDRYPEIFGPLAKREGIRMLEVSGLAGDFVQGRSVAHLAWEAVQGGLERPGMLIHPRYLRASDAEIKLSRGLLASTKLK